MLLSEIGIKHNTDKAHFHKYCDFYQEHLPGRDFKGSLLEIGVMDGASLAMWREYYPEATDIVGIDINDKKHLKMNRVSIHRMDGTDTKALAYLGAFDIIVDDGSHMTADQQSSFEHLYLNQLNPGGFYIIEDIHTSLLPNYVNSDMTTLEYLDHAKIDYEFYRRDESVNDSMTCIIRAGQSLKIL